MNKIDDETHENAIREWPRTYNRRRSSSKKKAQVLVWTLLLAVWLQAPIDYTSKQIQNSDIMKEQKPTPTINNICTGKPFAKDPKPFNSADLTEEEKNQLVKLTPEQQAQYIQQYNSSAATYEENLAKLGVIDKSKPAIEFPTSSFQQKQELRTLSNAYNTAETPAKTTKCSPTPAIFKYLCLRLRQWWA